MDLDWWLMATKDNKAKVVRKFLKVATEGIGGNGGGPEAVDPEFAGQYPALHEYLTATTDGEGKSRKTGSFLIFVDGSEFKCFFSDRQNELQLCATAGSVLGLFQAIEDQLEGETPPWRKKPAYEQGKRK
jgi:hypothetical protein